MTVETEFLLQFFWVGIQLSFLYDLFRLFRKVVPHRPFWISVEDLIFWFLCGKYCFHILYIERNGVFRWYTAFGLIVGIGVYRKIIELLTNILKIIKIKERKKGRDR